MRLAPIVLALSILPFCIGSSSFAQLAKEGVFVPLNPNAGPLPDALEYLPPDVLEKLTRSKGFGDVKMKEVKGDYDLPPQVKSPPTMMQMEASYPADALRAGGIDGHVTLRCIVSSLGVAHSCDVRTERPRSNGFDDAALSLARAMSFKPATKAGAVVASEVDLVMDFRGPGKPTGSVLPYFDTMNPTKLVGRIKWLEAPSIEQVQAVYPEQALARKASGHVLLSCVFGDAGRLGSCDVKSETPVGKGFGQAAKRLVPLFASVSQLSDGKPMKGVQIELPIAFDVEALQLRQALSEPNWEQRPASNAQLDVFPDKALAAGIQRANTEVQCRVAPTGALADCRVVAENPSGQGFAEASLRLAEVYRAPKWSASGEPLIGATVRTPITFQWPTETKAATR